ncbi:glycerol-3-phosphate dehydrogenase, partial [Sulfitobacter guttiformis]
GDIIQTKLRVNSSEGVRLVRGSHIVTPKLYDHDKCYFFQGSDGRIIFAIPYETDFTLIGTTDADHDDPSLAPVCTDAERDYLVNFANQYFENDISADDVVWTYSGVRPLYDDGASSASAATRDYVLKVDDAGPPLLNIFGGKITTYRVLAEDAMDMMAPYLPALKPKWTAGAALPGGDFEVSEVDSLIAGLLRDYPFLTPVWAKRLVRAYGTDARGMLGTAKAASDLGTDFGATLTQTEVRYLITHEYATCAADIVWRRSKLGLRMTPAQITALDVYMTEPA